MRSTCTISLGTTTLVKQLIKNIIKKKLKKSYFSFQFSVFEKDATTNYIVEVHSWTVPSRALSNETTFREFNCDSVVCYSY